MASCALRTATLRPPTWARRPSEMLRPAASSAARLMRKPEDSFSSDLAMAPSVTERFRYAFMAAMFWLMRIPMIPPGARVRYRSVGTVCPPPWRHPHSFVGEGRNLSGCAKKGRPEGRPLDVRALRELAAQEAQHRLGRRVGLGQHRGAGLG